MILFKTSVVYNVWIVYHPTEAFKIDADVYLDLQLTMFGKCNESVSLSGRNLTHLPCESFS